MAGSGRSKSTVAGDNKSGHIEAGKDEGIFFIDSEDSGDSCIWSCCYCSKSWGSFSYDLD